MILQQDRKSVTSQKIAEVPGNEVIPVIDEWPHI